jgi:hypothetical protein
MPRKIVDKHNDVLIPQVLFAQITRHRLGRRRYIHTFIYMLQIKKAGSDLFSGY